MARSEINPTPTNSMRNKLFGVVFIIILVMTGYICVRLFDTAVINAEYYRGKANEQHLRDFIIPANRGTIYDRNGKILAQSKTVWTIILNPRGIRENAQAYQEQRTRAANRAYQNALDEGLPAAAPVAGTQYSEAEEICRALADIFDLDYDALLKRCLESNLGYEIVKKQADKAQVDLLLGFKREKGIGTFSVYHMEDTKRFYPNANLAANVIGFTNYDNIGVYGVEAFYDEQLQGVNGLFVMARDANNQAMPYDYEMRYEAQNGNSLYLTIDEVLQHYLEKNMEIAASQHKPLNRSTGIVMNAKTGAILAMATYPSFDLNEPSVLSAYDYALLDELRAERINTILIQNGFAVGTEADLTPEEIEAVDKFIRDTHSILRETQWKNKAVSELYFPGSVFKVVTNAMAVEEQAVALEHSFFCPGHATVADTKFHCWNLGGHGQVPGLTMAITKSCNPAFIEIARQLGSGKFLDYFEAFGFTRRTGVDLPGEASPLFLRREAMGPVELASSSFGQTNKITPLQMITAYAATVNGGFLVTPYVVDKIIDDDGNIVHSTQPNIKRQVVSEETSAIMRRMLEDVVEYNGGTNAYIAGYRIGGKSGTSQKIDEFPEGDRYVASFCAFTPANDPEIIMLVMVDDPTGGHIYGSAIAAPVISAVFKECLPYLQIHPTQFSAEELAMRDTVVPYLKDLSLLDAKTRLNREGLNYRFVGEDTGSKVLYTVPQAGQPIARNGTVVVYMAQQDYLYSTVPDVFGLSPAKANEAITNAGLNIKLSGAIFNDRATARLQSFEAGTVIPSGTVVEVEFIFVDGHTG